MNKSSLILIVIPGMEGTSIDSIQEDAISVCIRVKLPIPLPSVEQIGSLLVRFPVLIRLANKDFSLH